MDTVITLVSTPPRPALSEADISTIIAAVKAEPAQVDWLHPGVAVDLYFSEPLKRPLPGGWPFDLVCQPVAGRRKKLLLADMDATLVVEESLDELAKHVGKGPEVAAITARAMQGELNFAAALEARLALLRGLSAGEVAEVVSKLTLMPGAENLIATMQAHGATCHLVSGGFQPFAAHVAKQIGLTSIHCNEFVFGAAGLLGVKAPILGKEAKVNRLATLTSDYGLTTAQTMAVGDGANDIPMLTAAGLGVAFRAKPKTVAAAPAAIHYSDLTALLYLQGYRSTEFVGINSSRT